MVASLDALDNFDRARLKSTKKRLEGQRAVKFISAPGARKLELSSFDLRNCASFGHLDVR